MCDEPQAGPLPAVLAEAVPALLAEVEAVDLLLAKLAEVSEAGAEAGRSAIVDGIAAVSLFLSEMAQRRRAVGVDVPVGLEELFLRLAGALRGLDAGTVDPILKPAETHNRAPVPFVHAYARAQAGAAMDALMRVTYTREEAARFVARRLAGSPLLAVAQRQTGSRRQARTKEEPWRMVARWRDDLARKKMKDAPGQMAADRYQDMTQMISIRIVSGEWDRARVERYAREQCASLVR